MNIQWCGKCNSIPCICAFKRDAVDSSVLAVRARAVFRDALTPVLERLHSTPGAIDAFMSAYDAVHAPKPKDYSCANCSGTFTTTQQPHICPFCQQVRLSTKEPNGT